MNETARRRFRDRQRGESKEKARRKTIGEAL